ncbi:MAG: electron transfer flavoprotein alpha subunit [Planctomycetota bacterium]|jgi:electron transfer flavoprotein alpha subunit
MTTIVTFVDQKSGAPRAAGLEALGAAHSTGADVVGVVTGAGAADAAAVLGAHGAKSVVVLTGADDYSPDRLAADLAGIVQAQSAQAFVASATSLGRDVAPRVAAHLDSTLFSDCTSFSLEGDAFTMVRPWMAGKLIATLQSTAPVCCVTLRRNNFTPVDTDGSAEVSETATNGNFLALLKEIGAAAGGKLDVADAPVIVSGGRGMKDAESFKLIEDLAAAFGNAAVGASRAVVDAGWRPHGEQVGQTGKTVSPQLYIAVGISGAIQHLAGMKTSKVIVAINKDADAPIFKIADFGIVGDAFEILPKLTEAVASAVAAS